MPAHRGIAFTMKMFVGSLLIVILFGNCQSGQTQREGKNYPGIRTLWMVAEFYSKRGTTLKIPNFNAVKQDTDLVSHAAVTESVNMGGFQMAHVQGRMEIADTRHSIHPKLNRAEYAKFKNIVDRVTFEDADFDDSGKVNWLEAFLAGAGQIGNTVVLGDLYDDTKKGSPRYMDEIEAFLEKRLESGEVKLIKDHFNKVKSSGGLLDRSAFEKFITGLYNSVTRKDYDLLAHLLGLVEVSWLPTPNIKKVKEGKGATIASIIKYFMDNPITPPLSHNAELYVKLLFNDWDYNNNDKLDETEYYLFQHSYGWVQHHDADFDHDGQIDWPEALVAVGAELGYKGFIRGLHNNSDGSTTMDNIETYFGKQASGYPLATARTLFKKHKVGTTIPTDDIGSFLDDIFNKK